MTRRKAMFVEDRAVWAWDDSHDIMVALLVEEAQETAEVDAEWLQNCRVAASISPFAAEFVPHSSQERALFAELFGRVRSRLTLHGDFHPEDLTAWSVLDGHLVARGSLRTEVLRVAQIEEVMDAIESALSGRLTPDSPTRYWIYGTPGGAHLVEVEPDPWEDLPNEPLEPRPVTGLRARFRRYLRQQ